MIRGEVAVKFVGRARALWRNYHERCSVCIEIFAAYAGLFVPWLEINGRGNARVDVAIWNEISSCLFASLLLSLSLSFSFRRNKRILEEGWWFKNAGITRVGGQTVFAHAKQRVNFEEYLFSVFVDIILYTCYFQTRVLNFLKRIE